MSAITASISVVLALLYVPVVCDSAGVSSFKGALMNVAGKITDQPAMGARLTVVGRRISSGDGVNCSQIRTDDGELIGVANLDGSIDIGELVQLTGFMTAVPTCRGPVLFAEGIKRLGE